MILTNIMLFDGKPFQNPIKLYYYRIKEEIVFEEIGNLIKNCRVENKHSILFQYGRGIYSTIKLKIPVNYKEYIESNEQTTIHLNHTEDAQDKLRYLLGETIATFLRNQKGQKWRADLKTGLVYQVIQLTASKEFEPLSIWYGFRYSPLVFDNGRVGLIIDPSYKMFWKKTLRQLYDENNSKMPNLGDITIDTCPDDDCILKEDPFSICDLSGHGKTVRLVDIDPIHSPKTAIIEYKGFKMNIHKYNNDIVCPLKKMGTSIDEDKFPIAIVNIGKSSKAYMYPLERLRKKAEFSDIQNNSARQHLMNLIQPLPETRFKRTIRITEETLSTVNFKPFLLIFSSLVNSDMRFQFQIEHISPVEMQLNESKRSRNPAIDLEEDKPYDFNFRKFNEIIVSIVSIGVSEEEMKEIEEIKKIILNGQGIEENEENSDIDEVSEKSEIIPSLKKYVSLKNVKFNPNIFYVNLDGRNEKNIELLDEYIRNNNIEPIQKTNSAKTIILRIYGKESVKYNTDYIKDHLVSKDIPNQGISLQSYFKEKDDWLKVKGYFKNIYLGIYAKVGGLVWALHENIGEKNTIYFGYSSIFKEDKIVFSLTQYNNRGIWIKGIGTIVSKEDFGQILFKILKENFALDKNTQAVFHVRGKLKSYIELEEFKRIFNKINGKFRIIEFTESPIRLYKQIGTRIVSPRGGTYIKINSKQIALLTYYFKLKSKTPDPIVCHFAYGEQKMFEQDVKHSFYLTQCYCGYLKQQTKYPVTAYSANKITERIQNFKKSLNKEFVSQWYI